MIAVAMGHLALIIRFLTAALRWAGVHLSARYISLLLTQPVLGGDDFDADIAERYGLVNRTLDDDGLDSSVDTLVRRLASFDRETIAAAKAQINRFGMPTATELQSTTTCSSRSWPGPVRRRAVPRSGTSVTEFAATSN